MQHRPEQRYLIDELNRRIEVAFETGEKFRICASAVTGAGKSLVVHDVIAEQVYLGRKVAIYSHRILLTEQIVTGLKKLDIPFGVRAAGNEADADANAMVQMCSLQTESSRVLKKRDEWVNNGGTREGAVKRYQLFDADVVFIDEMHAQTGEKAEEIFHEHWKNGACIIGVTATPLGVSHILPDGPLIAGNSSSARQCGAILPAVHYACEEICSGDVTKVSPEELRGELWEGPAPRVNHKGDLDEFVPSPKLQQITACVIPEMKRLNPENKPWVGFAPGVPEARYLMDECNKAGISAACIDCNDVWVNGQRFRSNKKKRAEVISKVRNGEISGLWNRFVLREGIDIPNLAHLVLATPVPSLKHYVQTVGRVLRSDGKLTHICVSSDSKVITEYGEKRIRDLLLSDRVWDGVEFVRHEGAVCNGNHKTIEWCGLRATPDHKVLTSHGWERFDEAKAGKRRIIRGAVRGKPIRCSNHSGSRDSKMPPEGEVPLRMRKYIHEAVYKTEPEKQGLSGLQTDCLASREAGIQCMQGNGEEMHHAKRERVSQIRRQRHSVQIQGCIHLHEVDITESRPKTERRPLNRQNRQLWPLRRGQSQVGNSLTADEEQIAIHTEGVKIQEVPGEIPICRLSEFHDHSVPEQGLIGLPDISEMEEEVWDIVNCGPRKRFVANGLVVSNCIQDHGASYYVHGDANDDRDDIWREFYFHEKDDVASRVRKDKMRSGELTFPDICVTCRKTNTKLKPNGECSECAMEKLCPECGAVQWMMKTGRCYRCDTDIQPRHRRLVIQTDGSLQEVSGLPYRPFRVNQSGDMESAWQKSLAMGRAIRKKRKREGKAATWTYAQCRATIECGKVKGFEHLGGQTPPPHLPGMPLTHSGWYLNCDSLGKDECYA